MDKRFFNIFNLTQEQAIAILDTPQEQIVDEEDSRYIAASHLVNFPTEASIQALIRAVQQTEASLDNRIVRRKSVETLGRLQASQALPVLQACLADEDSYTVENAVWAIAEIGTQDPAILKEIAQLLDKPGQSYRVIIHALTKLNYPPSVDRIRQFVESSDAPIASAASAAIYRFTQDKTAIEKVVTFLQHPYVFARRLCIQDLIDAKYYQAIPNISRCPVSIVFRLRGIRMLAETGMAEGILDFKTIEPYLTQILRDRPQDLDLVHSYQELPTLDKLVRELYETDFGKAYLAAKTILEHYPESAPEALFATYAQEAHNDYGAHYHVVKVFGWLKHAPAYELLLEALNNPQPQFQKSRAAAAIALGELGDSRAIPGLLASLASKIWDLKYAALIALEKLGDTSGRQIAIDDSDWLVQAKARF
jgi:bilin biosynthesis protein